MVGIFGDHDVGDQRLGRQAAFDQTRFGLGLDDAGARLRAGILRTDGHQNPKLSRHDVETLRHILADLHHLAAAAGTRPAVRLDYFLNPRQVLR